MVLHAKELNAVNEAAKVGLNTYLSAVIALELEETYSSAMAGLEAAPQRFKCRSEGCPDARDDCNRVGWEIQHKEKML